MFKNIGKKIKILAIVIASIIIAIGVTFAIVTIIDGKIWAAILELVTSVIIAWFGNFTLYGFGEIIDKLTEIADNTKKISSNSNIDNLKQESNKVEETLISDNLTLFEKQKPIKTLNTVVDAKENSCPICNIEIEEGVSICPECGLDIQKRRELLN